MEKEQIAQLLNKFKAGTTTDAEDAFLEEWYAQYKGVEGMDYQLADRLEDANQIWAALSVHDGRVSIGRRLWPRVIGVAAAIAAIVFGVWFYNANYKNGRHPESNPEFSSGSGSPLANDVAPGKNTATLTLANGKVITLSDAKTGVVIGSELKYSDGSALQGVNAKAEVLKQVQDDVVVSTPRGGTYQVTLPDGTRVWLNADSKISFPSQFIGKERKILLLYGEVYFEVEKTYTLMQGQKARQRFIVETMGQEVEVLGTHFNISAYKDEAVIKTTLLEGSVKVSTLSGKRPANSPPFQGGVAEGRGGKMGILKPGQQSIVTNNLLVVKEVNTEEAVDWKNGEFTFNNEALGSIMRKISRWYDVEVQYQDKKLADVAYWGNVSRFGNVSDVLKMLETTGRIKFKIEGKSIIVSKDKE